MNIVVDIVVYIIKIIKYANLFVIVSPMQAIENCASLPFLVLSNNCVCDIDNNNNNNNNIKVCISSMHWIVKSK